MLILRRKRETTGYVTEVDRSELEHDRSVSGSEVDRNGARLVHLWVTSVHFVRPTCRPGPGSASGVCAARTLCHVPRVLRLRGRESRSAMITCLSETLPRSFASRGLSVTSQSLYNSDPDSLVL